MPSVLVAPAQRKASFILRAHFCATIIHLEGIIYFECATHFCATQSIIHFEGIIHFACATHFCATQSIFHFESAILRNAKHHSF